MLAAGGHAALHLRLGFLPTARVVVLMALRLRKASTATTHEAAGRTMIPSRFCAGAS
jgi:hypothetical protein